jgi:cytochrome c peroxidase
MWLAVLILTARVDLGRHLFYDKRLSANNQQSCATCHRQDLAFTDGKAHAIGSTGQQHPRSAMSLVNLRKARLLTWNNPHPQTLEEQALIPMFGKQPVELATGPTDFLDDPVYHRLLEQAQLPPTIASITQALAIFERTLISNDSPWDRYHYHGDDSAISASAKRGEVLFFSEPLSCFRCHQGEANELKDNGLLPEGGRFKPPTLRNIAVTAPYMHDGRLPTLDAVIDHYAKGGTHSPHQDELIRGFPLTEQDRIDLLAYLQSLTDQTYLHNPRYSNPW